jgi:hypothetical protein
LEAKKAKEAFKREQWELERKRARKILVPKCFMKLNYWNPEAANANSNAEELKTLERLQVISKFNVFFLSSITLFRIKKKADVTTFELYEKFVIVFNQNAILKDEKI